MKNLVLIIVILMLNSEINSQQNEPVKEIHSPVPVRVVPGNTDSQPPSDAVILFDGKNLDEWISNNNEKAAQWTVANGAFTVKKGTGAIRTKKVFSDYQLHIEWRIPKNITGSGQGRGNSGVTLVERVAACENCCGVDAVVVRAAVVSIRLWRRRRFAGVV